MNDITDAAVRALVTELVGKALRDRFGIELKEPGLTPQAFGAVPDRGESTGHPEAVERAAVQFGKCAVAIAATVADLGEGSWNIASSTAVVGPEMDRYEHLWYQACNRLRRLTAHLEASRNMNAVRSVNVNAALERATPDELLAALLAHPDISETDPTHELARAVIRALYDAL